MRTQLRVLLTRRHVAKAWKGLSSADHFSLEDSGDTSSTLACVDVTLQ